MRSHILKKHPTADVDIYKTHFEISQDEIVLMKGAYLAKPRRSKKKTRVSTTFQISEVHSSRLALRFVFPRQICTLELTFHFCRSIDLQPESASYQSASEIVLSDKDGAAASDEASSSEDEDVPELSDGSEDYPSGDEDVNSSSSTSQPSGPPLPHTNTDAQPSELDLNLNNGLPTNTSNSRPSRISSRRRKERHDDDDDGACPECDQEISSSEILSCDAPLCIQKVRAVNYI
jgi:hypothetical protein